MRVTLRGEPITLDDTLLLGHGGEARVYRHPRAPLALKVWHGVDAQANAAERQLHAKLTALREHKLTALLQLITPADVVRPDAPLLDARGAVCGYAMAAVPGALELARLARPDRPLDNNAVVALFQRLADTTARVHAAGCVVGDLNEGNVLLAGGAPHLIDVDSWQVGALPCPVAHERFLDPRLFGVDLAARCAFTPLTDAWALRVLLFQSLLFVHPYGGVHQAHKTMLRRAEARHSVLRGDVALPRRAASPDTLPDALRDDFERAFDHDVREPFVVPAVRFTRCACGVVHGRASCPACRVLVVKPAVRVAGRISAETLVEARTAILDAVFVAGRLAVLVDDAGTLRREDRSAVGTTGDPTLRAGVAADGTVLSRNGRLERVRGTVREDAGPADAWCTSAGGLFVLDGDSVVQRDSGRRVARVLPSSALFGSFGDTQHPGLALFRAGAVLRGVWFGHGSPTDLPALPVAGRVAELAVSFGDGRALIGAALDVAAGTHTVREHALFLVDARGQLLAHARGRPHDALLLGTIRGFALAWGKVLAPTTAGVVAFEAEHGAFVERARFDGTDGFVDESSQLLASPGGELVVVDARSIVKLRMGRSG